MTLTLANNSSGTGTCNINADGTLQAGTIVQGIGIANFNWNDGIIQNYAANTDLGILSGLILKLAATGKHTFNIDLSRTGTIDAVLSDATTKGTLTKTGAGMLTLTGANTYSGQTVVEAGRFKVTGSILSTNGVTVNALATLELASAAGSATAANLAISNAGTLEISTGSQSVGVVTGTGITQVDSDANLTASSIVQGSLIIGSSGSGITVIASTTNISQVPEPSAFVLIGMGAFGFLAWIWRRNCKSV